MVVKVLKKGFLAGMAVVGLEAAYAVLRPAPDLPEFDPSDTFGDPASPPLRVAVMGDSSVTSPGVSGPEEIWVTLVCRKLAETHHVTLKSFAVGGSKASDLVENQLQSTAAFRPDLIFVSVGANDALKGVPKRRFRENLDHLIGELAATGALVVQSGVGDLGTIPRFHPPLRNLMTRRGRTLDTIHREVAEKHGTVVIDRRDEDTDLWYRERHLWAEDLFHVSAAGHARWAEMVWRTVAPLFARVDGEG
jgi:lysophospholipase L1-like esterase